MQKTGCVWGNGHEKMGAFSRRREDLRRSDFFLGTRMLPEENLNVVLKFSVSEKMTIIQPRIPSFGQINSSSSANFGSLMTNNDALES